MDKMQFGTFVWPENPENYQEICIRKPVYTQTEDGTTVFSGMGVVKRTITGSGVFSGSGAYTKFQTLAARMKQTAPETLKHPVWGDRSAYLTELTSTLEARDDYVAYSFTFQEADSNGGIPE